MNYQEPGYTAPETPSGDPRPINTDPREQPGLVPPTLNTDPREQPRWQVVPPIVMTPHRGRSRWHWFIVGVIILAIIFGGLALTSLALARTITETKHFTVGDQPALVLTTSDGDVHLNSGPARQITIVAHKHTFAGSGDQLNVDYNLSSDGNTLTVSYNEQFTFNFSLFIRTGVDFDVMVPTATALNVQTSNGSVDASGISGSITLKSSNGSVSTNGGSGQVTLTTSNGSIQASNVSGQITLTTSNGSIEADNASGVMRVKTSNGSIKVSGASLSGDSTFETSDGSITFSGSLAPPDSYFFRTSNGSIDVTLPANSSFQVSSQTSNGSLNSDFNGTTNGQYGSAPFAVLTLQTSNGSITIHKA